jgi:hypothetical protein
MAEGRGLLRRLSSLLLFGGTALGLYNVYCDNADVRLLAEKSACGNRVCTARVTRESRSPIGQSFSYETELTEKGKSHRNASVDVECKRAFFLVGAYSCVAQGVLPP